MPISRPDQLPPRQAATVAIGPLSLTDDLDRAQVFQLWQGSKITLNVSGNPIYVQLSRDDPPNPPTWDVPIWVNPGPWSHAGPWGYVRLANAFRGAVGTVVGTGYRE
jgi:hypothetical protein